MMVGCRVLPALMDRYWANANDSFITQLASLNQEFCKNLTTESSLITQTSAMDQLNCSHQNLQILTQPGRIFFLYVYPFLLLVCVVVNLINVRVYFQPFLRYCTTIRLLAAESVANLLYMVFLMPNLLISHSWALQNEMLARFYANTSLYFTFLVNTLGTFAAWITVVVTLERYAHIAYPIRTRRWSTLQNVHLGILLCLSVSAALHLVYPINRWVRPIFCPVDNQFRFQVRQISQLYDQLYNYISSVTVILLPPVLLIVFTLLINYELFCRRRISTQLAAADQKRCVTRLTLATTVCYLVLESPQSITFTVAAINGSANLNQHYQLISSITNIISMVNTTLPFFVYLACSHRFRQICSLLWCKRCQPISSEDIRVLKANNTRNLSLSYAQPVAAERMESQSFMPLLKGHPQLEINMNDTIL